MNQTEARMDRFWLKSYPPGIPADINLGDFSSIDHVVQVSCAKYADRVAFVQMGRSITYRQLDEMTRRLAAWLQKEAGLKKGDRLAIMLPNMLQYPIAIFGALRAGL